MDSTGPGLSFDVRRVSGDTAIVMGPDLKSVAYLVSSTRRDPIALSLPAAATATSRFITVTNIGSARRITLVTQAGETIDRDTAPFAIEGQIKSVTLATDGVEWIVVSVR